MTDVLSDALRLARYKKETRWPERIIRFVNVFIVKTMILYVSSVFSPAANGTAAILLTGIGRLFSRQLKNAGGPASTFIIPGSSHHVTDHLPVQAAGNGVMGGALASVNG
ncbi:MULTISPECIES: hypothetical protein [unclassified Brenneria]|uniref:hypothetical protein n=1 Tax=unclassified Brenneria TaxID=2634434 RepID=UPI0029C1C4F8|nr:MULTISPECIES: hypothetical protein [unclassified Brenneria]MDX5629523.1 hypothetical protein [Brenneria sp. L3-3Z]MDX5696662.1 hypothetical protein [Brenneria sp. L4-2C]